MPRHGAMRKRSIAKRLERGERCRQLGFSLGPGMPSASQEPSVLVTKEVLRREREARPALRALIAGQLPSSTARRHRNVAWHNKVIPPPGAPESDWTAAQRGARLGASHPTAVTAEKVVFKYIVIEVPPVLAPGIWTPGEAANPPHEDVGPVAAEATAAPTSSEEVDPQALLERSRLMQDRFSQLADRSRQLQSSIAYLRLLAECVEEKELKPADPVAHFINYQPRGITAPEVADQLMASARNAYRLGQMPADHVVKNRFGTCCRIDDPRESLPQVIRPALKRSGSLVFDNGLTFLVLESAPDREEIPASSHSATCDIVQASPSASSKPGGIFATAVDVVAGRTAPIVQGASHGPWAPIFKKGAHT